MPDSPARGGGSAAATPPQVSAKSRWRAFNAAAAGQGGDLRVGIAASFTADGLEPMLGTALLDAGFHPRIDIAPYDQILQTCLNHTAQFSAVPDVIVLLWRIEDLMLPELTRYVSGDKSALDDACDKTDELVRAVGHLRGAFGGTLIVALPPFPQGVVVDLLDLDQPRNAGRFYRTVTARAERGLLGIAQLRLADVDALQRHCGAKAIFDARKWHLYKQPYTEAFLWELGLLLARIVSVGRVSVRKCVVLDCDNTLWGGVVGEDGVGGIALGDDFPGSAYRDLQRLILYWRSQGIMLAIASKNNDADVWEVFDRHDGMVLKREHLSAWQINWNSKADSLKRIAAELNIGVDSLVFIDDNPFEIEQISRALPEVAAILLDEEPARMVGALKAAHLFDRLEITEEDARRADMMRAERQRTSAAQELNTTDFAATLELKVELARAQGAHLGRIAQLINKTNQFNLTTRRRTVEEVTALAADRNWRVYALRVSDKFGDYGLVGVAIVEIESRSVCRIDTLLLSCRVLGRTVETAFLAALAAEARDGGASELWADFIATAKNTPARDFLPSHGFGKQDGTSWTIALSDVPPLPGYISLTRNAAVSLASEP